MTKQQQVNFVRELCNNVKDSIVGQIDAGKIPETWDGHELRELLASKFDSERSSMMLGSGNARKQNYRNTVLVNNL